MNEAQRRTWKRSVVSLAGLLVMGGVLAVTAIRGLDIANEGDHTALRLLGLLCTVPLIALVFVDRGWRKVYDERDLEIERQALHAGSLAVYLLLAVIALGLTVTMPLGSIRVTYLPSLVYLAFFSHVLAASVAALVYYRAGGGHGE